VAMLMSAGRSIKRFGGELDATNNRIELVAPIKALESLRCGCCFDFVYRLKT
jgi:ribonuclease HI